MESVENRRVFVTGGTNGIGRAVAGMLAAQGAKVFVTGRSPKRLNETMKALSVDGTVCDVRDFGACEAAAAEAAERLGGIDALVNSAGIGIYSAMTDFKPDDWRDVIDINVTGTFNACKAAMPWLLKSPRADIINLGSRAGRYAFAGGTAYCASKFAIQGFSEALFLDLSKYGIAVSLVAPGPVATGFAGAAEEDWHLQPEDVAEAIVHCLTSYRGANLNWIEMRPSRRDDKGTRS